MSTITIPESLFTKFPSMTLAELSAIRGGETAKPAIRQAKTANAKRAKSLKAAKPKTAKSVLSPVTGDADAAVLAYLGNGSSYTVGDISKVVGDRAGVSLKRLLSAGAITKSGQKRGTRYAIAVSNGHASAE